MNLLIRGFLRQFETKYAELGFRKVRKGYARIVNDVFQTINIEKLSGKYQGNDIYRVCFGIFPLCMEINCCDIGLYCLEHFSDDIDVAYVGWMCNAKQEESVASCLQAIFDRLNNDLIPLFLRADCCEFALQELIKLDKLLDSNRQRCLSIMGEKDLAKPWEERSMHSPEKYYMALKCGDWQYANKYLALKISYYEGVLSPNASVTQLPFVIENISKALNRLREEQAKLQAEDHLFFEQLLLENEAKTRKNLCRDSGGKIV